MLPLYEQIVLEVGYICWTWAEVGIKDNPSNVGP